MIVEFVYVYKIQSCLAWMCNTATTLLLGLCVMGEGEREGVREREREFIYQVSLFW